LHVKYVLAWEHPSGTWVAVRVVALEAALAVARLVVVPVVALEVALGVVRAAALVAALGVALAAALVVAGHMWVEVCLALQH
jgi:hypothetical protein